MKCTGVLPPVSVHRLRCSTPFATPRGSGRGRAEKLVVAGGKSSGNTKRLAELARMRGVPTVLVETADEIDAAAFSGVRTVGLTAGASTPRYIIDEVERKLRLL